MVTDGVTTQHGEHRIIQRIAKSVCYTPETNNIVCQLYFNNLKKWGQGVDDLL